MANRLANTTSPYLRQHADNPVDWHEWGPEALAEARERDVPIFLSVGYAACHWCHVMAHESFEDPVVAELVNRTSVPIKVDREERPDIDTVHMSATIALTGQGGWPMSVWLTPEGHPFHAGTYFPPEPRHGMPSFTDVVTAVAQAWQDRRDEVRTGASDIAAELAARTVPPAPGDIGPAEIDQAVLGLAASYDAAHPGFGTMPKFPPSMVLDFLVARASQADGIVADQAWRMARDTCLAMANGGLFDQLGGGFARYSVDRAWLVPHFEKMLYDNALLLSVYGKAWSEARRRGEDTSRYSQVIAMTVDWVVTHLTTSQNGFASSFDADSVDKHGEHREGAFYVWTPDELEAALGPDDAATAREAFGLTDTPNFEDGTSVLQRNPDVELPDEIRQTLLDIRARRHSPSCDDKVVTAWNGWMIAALAETAMQAGRDDWLTHAVSAAECVLRDNVIDGALMRTSRAGTASSAPAVAEDFAGFAHGCAVLAQATGDLVWLTRAIDLLDELHTRFVDEAGLHDTAADAEELFLRPREIAENATPSATTAALRATRMVHRLTGDDRWRQRADALQHSCGELAVRAPRGAGWALSDAVSIHGARPATEIAVLGADPGELLATAWTQAPAGSVFLAGQETEPTAVPTILSGRTTQDGVATAYVCRGETCLAPVTTVAALSEALSLG